MSKVILHIVEANGFLTHDNEQPDSEALFDHLSPEGSLGKCNLPYLKRLASAHGWSVSVREAREDELEDESW